MNAMIFAAGLGTRLKPLTLSKPKALVEINGQTLLAIQILKLKAAGFDEIIINVHHFADEIIQYVKENNYFGTKIEFSIEKEKPLDTGGGLKKASWFFDDGKPFLLHNVDVLTNLDLNKFYNFHLEKKATATLAVRNRQTSRYLLFDEDNLLAGWEDVNKNEKILTKEKSTELKCLAFSGISVLSPEVFEQFPDKEIFSLIELFLNLSKNKNIIAFEDNRSYWFDVGTVEKLKAAEKHLSLFKEKFF